jgi:mono/diheme cytochrome c family protein
MQWLKGSVLALGVACLIPSSTLAADTSKGQIVYQQHCAACHGDDRLGRIGPALLPENLKRLRKKKALKVIGSGRPATQMPAFKETLDEQQIADVADYVYTKLATVPDWPMENIQASHVVHNAVETLGDKPVHTSDPLNLFTVVETGDHHVTILDGDTFESIWRFPSRFALHGGAKYSPDGRYVYFGSRDGWVSKYDLYSLKPVAEIRAGINTRNIAVSADGKYVMVGNFLPHSLVVLNADDLSPERVIPVADEEGKSSRVSAVYTARPRSSFIVAMKDIKEIWELSYDPDAEPIYGNFVHNYRAGQVEAVVQHEQPFGIRRIKLDDYMDDFFFDQAYSEVMGAARNAKKGQVVNLDVRKKIADLELSSMPHLGSGIIFQYEGREVMATPHLRENSVSVIDMETWETVKRIETLGPGFFMRSHENSDYAWVDVFFGKDRDAMHVIDKRTLEIVKTLRPKPGKTAAHVEFTRDGSHALVSIWEMDGALVIFDAKTLKEVRRIPMKKPSGKYNVYNKINLSAGTSH